MSHLGRPEGRKQDKFTLAPVAKELETLIGKSVTFINDCISTDAFDATANPRKFYFLRNMIIILTIASGTIILLENVRFYAEEEGKGVNEDGTKFKPESAAISKFRESLSQHGEIYINDAFGCAHRAHSSVVGINHPQRLNKKSVFH